MVLLPQDSSGPSALLKGGMLDFWNEVDQTWDMVDLYLPTDSMELTWGRVLELFKEFREQDRQKLSELKILQQELGELWEKIVEGGSEEDWEEYHCLQRRVQDGELLEASIAREDRQERNKVIGLIDKQTDEEDNKKVADIPEMKEVLDTLRRMARKKSPGEENNPVEVLVESWDWMGDKCLLLLQTIWTQRRLAQGDKGAIIKLLPKNEEKFLLKNWRPISLLRIVYKLMGKIQAHRLNEIIPKLVDEEQTGFITYDSGATI
ncbi:hypothetical protein R1sor_016278 [Riccia sorocarpa]|uniref:Reverse transcriptase domain-containing protein n=1 Tax=Riccia sorocarpa TaxID=122646 RepID=A0ABD3HHP7_9MARC